MRIALATLVIGNDFSKTIKPGLISKQEYCDLHNYDFVVGGDEIYDKERPPAWSKINLVRKILGDYDVVFLSDADVVITNPLVTLDHFVDTLMPEKRKVELKNYVEFGDNANLVNNYNAEITLSAIPDKLILLSRDNLNINTGNMFFKNDPKVMAILEDVYAQTQFIDDPWWEQRAFIHLYETQQLVRDVTQLVGASIFNTYEKNWNPGNFLIHLPGQTGHLLEAKMRQYYLMATVFPDTLLRQLTEQAAGV